MRLENKVALISGGARGMGAAEARLFSGEGAKVVIGDVLDEDGRQTEAAINEVGGELPPKTSFAESCMSHNPESAQESSGHLSSAMA